MSDALSTPVSPTANLRRAEPEIMPAKKTATTAVRSAAEMIAYGIWSL